MSNTNQTWNEKANALKDQAAEKLEELKEKASELADTVKEKAGQTWDKLNSPETKAQLDHLKDQAVEKLEEAEEKLQELGNKAKDLWNKATGHHEPDRKTGQGDPASSAAGPGGDPAKD